MVRKNPSCTEREVKVGSMQNICCPPQGCEMWDAHPRIYLAFAPGQQEVQCYYCGTRYRYQEKKAGVSL